MFSAAPTPHVISSCMAPLLSSREARALEPHEHQLLSTPSCTPPSCRSLLHASNSSSSLSCHHAKDVFPAQQHGHLFQAVNTPNRTLVTYCYNSHHWTVHIFSWQWCFLQLHLPLGYKDPKTSVEEGGLRREERKATRIGRLASASTVKKRKKRNKVIFFVF